MKKFILLLAAAVVAGFALQAKTADEFRIYLNPGHGSYGANDRPMKTIGHPNTGVLNAEGTTWLDTDTLGFYEGRGTLPRAFAIGDYLKSVGVSSENIVYSRTANGPWPYTTPNSEYDPDHIYNKNLADICEEVEEGNFDMFISSHSNAATDGTTTNYPLFLYRGYDTGTTGDAGYNGPGVEGSDDMARTVWPYHHMGEIEPQSHYSVTNMNVRGDISFYGSYSTATRLNGNQYSGYLGVLKHGVPGYLLEGFFHTYQPSRHRALNFDYDRLEGIREARGVATYWGFNLTGKGEIAGTVKDMHEKIVNSLYNYAYGSDDQWLPLNGAQVVLKKNGTEVATYTVDNEWNGFFAFFNLDPGNYTVEATAEGYKLLEEPIAATVTANNTCYSFIKLENEDYVPEEEVYENYPDPAQPGYLKLPGEFVFTQDEGTTYDGIVGTMAQALQYGDSTIVLSHEGTLAHLYIVDNNTKQVVKELNTEGLYTLDAPIFYNQIGSIALSADRKLVGVTAVRTCYNNDYADGYPRGTMHAYYWEDFDSAPTDWFSTQYSSNWYRSDLGFGVAVSGPIKECMVCVPAPTTGSTRGIRPAFFVIQDGNVVSTSRANAQGTLTMVKFGDPLATEGNASNYPTENFGRIKVAVSPFNDQAFIFGGSKTGELYELEVTSDGQVPAGYNVFTADDELLGNGMQIFKYAKHAVMVAPYGAANDVKGIKFYDITDGLASAKLINTVNTDVNTAADFAWAGATVNEEDIHAYLVGSDDYVVKFATDGVDQPKVKGIFAYDLRYNLDGDSYTFTFKANDDAKEAYITFRDINTDEELATMPIPNVVHGANEITIPVSDLPSVPEGEEGCVKMHWEITLVGDPIARIDLLNTPDDWHSTTSLFSTVDNYPESDYFGRIYVNERAGQPNENNGLWIYDQDWNKVNSTVLRGGLDLRSPYRVAVAPDGYVFLADWSDPGSGVFIMDPANPEGEFTQFFEGTRQSDGLFVNGDYFTGSSSTGIGFVGTGADTKMYAHLEDKGESIYLYNVGQPDGTIAHSWGTEPIATGVTMANGNVSICEDPTTGGVWISQVRGAGNNQVGTPSFKYLDPDGNVTFNSGDLLDLSGSLGAGLAVSHDGKELVLNNGEGKLEFFNIEWNEDGTPVLTSKGYTYTASVRRTNGTGHTNYIYQIHYDWGGNLICSGDQMGVYSMPTENNRHTTPAKKEYIVMTGEEQQNVPGDVNGDGYVTTVDVTVLYNYILNGDDTDMVNGDQNNDGAINTNDVTVVYNILLGNEE